MNIYVSDLSQTRFGKISLYILLMILIVLASAAGSMAQLSGRQVTGKVTDDLGVALQRVSVKVKGGTAGTLTGPDGTYSIKVPEGPQTLVFTSMGFITQERAVTTQQTIDVSLVLAVSALDEVVVVGYGTQKKSNLTGAVSTVNSETLENRPVANALEALQGSAPGLTIQQNSSEPGSGLNINIRGLGTLGDASPLIIVDGVASSIDNINPNDIDNISVLKDAASASIYGARAANGVILITTKRGTADSKPRLSVSSMVGVQQPTNLPNPVNSWEYAELRNEALVNSGLQPQFSPQQIRDFRNGGPNTNWLSEIFKKDALQQNHNVSVTGGGKATSYFLSAGYVNQESQFKGPDYGLDRYNVRLNLKNDVTDRITVGGSLAYSRTDVKEHAYWTEWMIEPATRMPSIYPIKDENGNYVLGSGSNANSLARLEQGGRRLFSNDGLMGNLTAEVKVAKGLRIGGLFGGDLKNNLMDEFRKSIDYAPFAGGGDNESSITNQFSRTLLLNSQLTANYETTIGKHAIQGLAGYSHESNTYRISQIRRIGLPGNDFGVISNGTTTDDNSTYGTGEEWSLTSLFGRLNYAYDNRYLLEGNFRYDGSSRFAEGNRFGFFPSVSAGWRITQEPAFAGLQNIFDELKLRGSWGQLGNQNIGLYRYLATVSQVTPAYSFGNIPATGAYFGVANKDITWETSTMVNVGLDGAMFNGKLTFGLEYFNKKTKDILLDLPVPDVFGGGSPTQNAGVVQNRGYEISLGWNQKFNNFSHSFSANLADNTNKVLDLKGQYYIYGWDVNTMVREGDPINSYFAYQADGFFQNQSEIEQGPKPSFSAQVKPGDIRYKDQNADGIIDEEDRVVLGNPFPRYTFGFNYTARWNGLDLGLLLQGVGKRSTWIRGEATEAFHNNNEGPVMDFHLDRWTPNNPEATYPRLTVGSESANNAAKSDFWIQNAAYLRVKNIQLGYTLPASVSKKAGMSNCRIFFTGNNLFTFSKLRAGYDPEVNNGNAQSGRVYPVAAVYAFGLDLKF